MATTSMSTLKSHAFKLPNDTILNDTLETDFLRIGIPNMPAFACCDAYDIDLHVVHLKRNMFWHRHIC